MRTGKIAFTAIGMVLSALAGCSQGSKSDSASANSGYTIDPVLAGLRSEDAYTMSGRVNFWEGITADNPDGTINVLVEIPAGTMDKWEVKPDGKLHWEMENGEPRVIDYIGYPCNYGTLVKTLSGDGDALDVILLGEPLPRGTIAKAKVLGGAKFVNQGRQDDKIIAVVQGPGIGAVNSIAELDAKYPGVTDILKIWFCNYKGSGKMEFKGYVEKTDASAILVKSKKDYVVSPKK